MERLPQFNITCRANSDGAMWTELVHDVDDGTYCWSEHALMLLAERDTKIAELEAEVARGEIYYRRLLAEYQEAVRDNR